MSANGTAVGAGVAVGEGDAVGEEDAFCACAPNAKHSNSRPTSSKAARRASVIVSVIPQSLGTQSLKFNRNFGLQSGATLILPVVTLHKRFRRSKDLLSA